MVALAVAVAACEGPQSANRNNIDFIRAKKPSPLARVRSAIFPNDAQRSSNLQNQADLVVDYDNQGKMTAEAISGKPADVAITPGFLALQKRKSLVVVLVSKTVWSAEEQARHLAFLNDHFTRHGYRRVVILLSLSNPGGSPVLSDTSPPGVSRPKFQRRWDR